MSLRTMRSACCDVTRPGMRGLHGAGQTYEVVRPGSAEAATRRTLDAHGWAEGPARSTSGSAGTSGLPRAAAFQIPRAGTVRLMDAAPPAAAPVAAPESELEKFFFDSASVYVRSGAGGAGASALVRARAPRGTASDLGVYRQKS